MKGHGAKLPRKQQQAIAALIEYPTMKEAAKTVGIGEVTLFRWMQDQEFQRAYRRAKKQVVDQAISRLQQVSREAVEALRAVMNDADKPPSARVTAAKAVLDMSIKAIEIEDLEARINALEQKLSKESKR